MITFETNFLSLIERQIQAFIEILQIQIGNDEFFIEFIFKIDWCDTTILHSGRLNTCLNKTI